MTDETKSHRIAGMPARKCVTTYIGPDGQEQEPAAVEPTATDEREDDEEDNI